MSRHVIYSPAALSVAASGRELPSWPVTEAYVRACGGDVALWREHWEHAREAVEQSQRAADGAARAQPFGEDPLDWPSVRFRILGPLQMISSREGLGSTSFAGTKERALLATLLLRANEHVSAEHLADSLWQDDPPASAATLIVVYVARLRKRLGVGLYDDCSLVSLAGGYRLEITPDALDLHVFERALEDARRLRSAGDLDAAAVKLKSGLDLWLGEPLADVRGGEFIEASRQQLAERRMAASKELLALQIELGEHREAVDVLTGLVSSHPFDEELMSLRMAALHRSGRTADALAVYRDFRRTLDEQLGIEPSARSGLVHQKILKGDTDLLELDPLADRTLQRTASIDDASPIRRPAELPAAVPRLHGRAPDFRTLDHSAKSRGTVAIVTGMPGVGKTALAVHWAQAHRQDFPDGQLYVNLLTPGGERAGSDLILSRMLSSLGFSGSQIPAGTLERAALYRTLLADRRVLIVLDDAQSADQVLPLIPGSPMCMTVITTRTRLAEVAVRVGAVTVTLSPLDRQSGIALLSETLGSHRVEAEPVEAAELVRLCGGLPLALQVVGGHLRARPTWSLATTVYRLAAQQPDLLKAGNINVRGVIEAAYRSLPREPARLLRLLATHPVESIDADTAAQIAGMNPLEVETNLSILLEAHMVSEVSPGSYQCHGLLRVVASQLTESQQAAAPSDLPGILQRPGPDEST